MGQAKARRAAAQAGQSWPRDRVPETGVPTGSPSEWLRRDRRDTDMAVSCGSCQACCRAGYPIEMDDGTVLPPRADGTCPKMIDGACSIYDDRPAVCRNYDCRRYVFAGVAPNDLVGKSLSRWRLTADTFEDQVLLLACRLALQDSINGLGGSCENQMARFAFKNADRFKEKAAELLRKHGNGRSFHETMTWLRRHLHGVPQQ
jgi:hypothetical protein